MISMTVRWRVLLLGTCIVVPMSSALAAPSDVVRDLASRVGPIVGQASTCQTIAQGRLQTIVDQFGEVIRQSASNNGERDLLTRSFNGYIADGRSRMAGSQTNCPAVERQLAELERSLNQQQSAAPLVPFTLAPPAAAAATQPTARM